MNRRKFIASIGALAGGGAVTVGTGAFSSVEAQRNIDVTVAGDAAAYLGIQPTDGPNGNYVDKTANDALALSLTDSNGNMGGGLAGGEGLNANAVTSLANVFEIKNQGTQDIELAVTPLAYGDVEGSKFPPDIDGAIAAFLLPQNPDQINVEIKYGWNGLFPDIDVSFIGIKDVSPGQKLTFNLLGVVIGSDAVGQADVDDQLEIHAQAV